MSGLPKAPLQICSFCGVATAVNHETQEACIAALHAEIARMRNILSSSRPTGVSEEPADEAAPKIVRIGLD